VEYDGMLMERAESGTWAPLPANVEVEAALLGAMMVGDVGWLIERAADTLTSASFHEPVHGKIFDAIQRQHSLGKPATPMFVKGYFDNDPSLDALGGNSYLARMTASMEGLLAPQEFIRQVADLAGRRKIMTAMHDAYRRCSDMNVDLPEIVSSVDVAIDQRAGDSIVESDLAECMEAFTADLDAETVGVQNHRIEAIDDLVGALEPKSLTILAARPGMGKTAVATNYALGAARSGHGVTFVSLEMSRQQLAGRMVADASFDDADRRIPYSAIQKRSLNPWQRERVNDLAKLVGKLPLNVIDAGTLTIGRLERLVRSQKRQMAARGVKLELVVVDYLQLLHCDDRKRSAYEAISEISTRLKGLAKDHDLAVLALAQLSRTVETRPDKRPILSDLRDSGQIEQDADAVLFLLREEYYVRQTEPKNDPEEHDKWQDKLNRCMGTIDFILAKRRNGTTGTAQGRFYGAYQAVR
jgi:replicative DNA helicase